MEEGCFAVVLMVFAFTVIVLACILGERNAEIERMHQRPAKAWSLYLEAKDYEFNRHQVAMGKVGR